MACKSHLFREGYCRKCETFVKPEQSQDGVNHTHYGADITMWMEIWPDDQPVVWKDCGYSEWPVWGTAWEKQTAMDTIVLKPGCRAEVYVSTDGEISDFRVEGV